METEKETKWLVIAKLVVKVAGYVLALIGGSQVGGVL